MTSGQSDVLVASSQPRKVVDGNAQQTPASESEEIWDETKLEQAMKTLKEMHIQVRQSLHAGL